MHGNVQGARGLVAHHHGRPSHQGARNRDALALPARQLAGLAVGDVGCQAHAFEHLKNRPLARLRVETGRQGVKRFGNGTRNAVAGVERGGAVLKDKLHVVAKFLELPAVEARKGTALVEDLALARHEHAAQDVAQRRLARTRLAYDAQGLAGMQRHAHAVECAHAAGAVAENMPKADALHDRVVHRPSSLGSEAASASSYSGRRTSRGMPTCGTADKSACV